MSAFFLVYPPSNTIINTYSTDTTWSTFTWTKSSSHPSIRYKWKIRKYGTSTEVSCNSNNNGSDSVITLRNSLLDSIAMGFGGISDTISCIWRVFSYNGMDSLSSQNQYLVYLIRHVIGIKIISSSVPGEFNLFENYPNPFNPSTKIRYDLPKGCFVEIVLYDVLGNIVETLVNEKQRPGTYEVTFNGEKYASGIYFYKITAGGFTNVKKMVLLK
jgi:hypothetical protein